MQIAPQRGFTLTELLISLVLGTFVIGGVLSVFLGGLESFRMTDSLSRMQESGRFALQLMRRDLREAGYVGCRNTLRQEAPRTDGPLDPGLIRNTLSPAPSGASDPLDYEYDFSVPLMGYEATGDGTGTSWTAADAAATAPASVSLMTNPKDDSDIVVLVATRGAGLSVGHSVGTPSAPGSANLTVPSGSGLASDDVVLVTDCASAAVFTVTDVTGSGTPEAVEHDIGTGTPSNYTTALGRSFQGAELYRVERAAFYVADSPTTGRPTLYRNDQEIAENVEQLQILYGIDSTFDARVNDYVTAAQIASNVNVTMDNVLAIRLNLLFSSGEEDNLVDTPVTDLAFAGGDFDADADDFRLYRVFVATVGVRNRLP